MLLIAHLYIYMYIHYQVVMFSNFTTNHRNQRLLSLRNLNSDFFKEFTYFQMLDIFVVKCLKPTMHMQRWAQK